MANEATESDLVVHSDQDSQQVSTETNQPTAQPTKLESFFAITKSLIIRAIIIYFVSSFLRRPSTTTEINSNESTDVPSAVKKAANNFFQNGTPFDMYVYISDDQFDVNFTDTNSLVWYQENLIYGDWNGRNGDGTITHHTKIHATEELQKNGSIYIHVFVTRLGKSPNPADIESYAGEEIGHSSRLLNKYKKIRYQKTHNLLTGQTEQIVPTTDTISEPVSHWHPNLTINLVTDQTNWMKGAVPQPLDEYIHFSRDKDVYFPIIFINDYWNMIRDYQPINETTPVLDLSLTYQPLSLFKWQLYAAQAAKNKWTTSIWGESMTGVTEENEEDQDSLKETLLSTNPYLLGITVAISILHSIFELLAFKNDIQFWNNRKSLEGLSVRSVFFGVFQSFIVLLYVLDNETNFMIRVSCFIGLGIELWKIQKVVDFKFNHEDRILGIIPRLTFSDKGSYVESSTKVYDSLAFKYLGWLCFPLLVGYGVYSVLYNEHKGWYSFVLNMLYGFLLTFGFILMTPQLFINYKLKSVAHLPWRMMTYKFLNTFIDDIFAFVIKMPTMYRLGCFRDDIVFFIFLYQRWIYKVDKSRVNEFGFSGEMADGVESSEKPKLEIEETSASKPKKNKKQD